jgi:hypothetical protein
MKTRGIGYRMKTNSLLPLLPSVQSLGFAPFCLADGVMLLRAMRGSVANKSLRQPRRVMESVQRAIPFVA